MCSSLRNFREQRSGVMLRKCGRRRCAVAVAGIRPPADRHRPGRDADADAAGALDNCCPPRWRRRLPASLSTLTIHHGRHTFISRVAVAASTTATRSRPYP